MIQRTFVRLFALLILSGCAILPSSPAEQAANDATPTPIPTSIVPVKPTYRVQKGEVIEVAVFTGRISPVIEEDLFFISSGHVRRVSFLRNAMLKRGDVIAELEIDSLERQLRSAELELERAQVALDEAGSALEFELKIAEVNLEMAQIRLDGLQVSLNLDAQAIALQEKELQLAQIARDKLDRGVSILIKNDVERAMFSVTELLEQIAEAQIIAPFDGQLMSISLVPGQAVAGYRPVSTLSDITNLEVSADLSSDQMQLLAENMPASLLLASRPGATLNGSVRRLPYPFGSGGSGQTIEGVDKSTRVSIDQSAEEAGFELGDLVRVTVEVERKADVLWLPPQAIRMVNGRRFTVVIDGGYRRRVDLDVGIQTDERVEIENGLEEGMMVEGQ